MAYQLFMGYLMLQLYILMFCGWFFFLLFFFCDISTFVGNLMPKPSFKKNSNSTI